MPTYIRKEGRGEGQRAANCVRQGLVLTFFGAYPLVCPHNTFVQKQQTGTEIAESHTHASHFILMQDTNGSPKLEEESESDGGRGAPLRRGWGIGVLHQYFVLGLSGALNPTVCEPPLLPLRRVEIVSQSPQYVSYRYSPPNCTCLTQGMEQLRAVSRSIHT